MKVMALPSDKWDLIPLPPSAHSSVVCLYAQTRGCRYDWVGAVGTVFRLTQSKNRWFCSEFCATVMGITEGWRFSPGDLAAMFRREAV
jgi:putative cytoplasmic protein